MEHCVDLGWCEYNPAKGVQEIKTDKKERHPWPLELLAVYQRLARWGRESASSWSCQRCETTSHVSHTGSQPDPRVRWDRNHAERPRINRASASGS